MAFPFAMFFRNLFLDTGRRDFIKGITSLKLLGSIFLLGHHFYCQKISGSTNRLWRLTRDCSLLGVFWGLMLAASGCEQVAPFKSPSDRPDIGTVSLEIDAGAESSAQTFELPVWADATVLDVMQSAQSREHLRMQVSGRGATAFIAGINDLKNRGSDGKNWIFSLNGELAKASCGVVKVVPGDRIQWKFGDYLVDSEEGRDVD